MILLGFQVHHSNPSLSQACVCELAGSTRRKAAYTVRVRYLLVLTGYLEGQVDLVSRLMIWIIRVPAWVIGVLNLLMKSP